MPSQDNPSKTSPPDAAPGPSDPRVVDFGFASSSHDEFEAVLNKLISPTRVRPNGRDARSGGHLEFHGTHNFSVFESAFAGVTHELPAEPDDNRLAFVSASRGVGQIELNRQGHVFSRTSGILMTSGAPRLLRQSDDCLMTVLILDRGLIASHCAKLLGRDLESDVTFGETLPLDTPSGQNWLRLVDYVNAELKQPSSLARTVPAAFQQIQQMVMTGLLYGHSHNYSQALMAPQSPAAPYYVKRAEAYIAANFGEPISLAEIASHAGVSARSLQNGFQNFRGRTPMAFLRAVRLQAAHERLLAADPAVETVTRVARDCGFNHLGEFSTHYKRTFDLTPREALLRTRRP
ncbi:AraC family transcriptional regulator [Microvirga antarctica]|uniref:AraC family transcriptional regulator n=1 Tax=Microvirga antarctica TaxID=2819233 RepID=UPI001B31324D|nr:AraC family transcriptional regulator [Microvirga antarctica]